MTEGQGDILERVPAGCYIMEELKAPEGFIKALPMGITVEEKAEIQTVTMMDEPTRAEFSKTDGKNSAFDCGYVKGATLGLWKTEDGTDQTEPVAEWITDEEPAPAHPSSGRNVSLEGNSGSIRLCFP